MRKKELGAPQGVSSQYENGSKESLDFLLWKAELNKELYDFWRGLLNR